MLSTTIRAFCALWRGTGLAELCERLLPAGKEQVAWEKMATVLVAARLCEPFGIPHTCSRVFHRHNRQLINDRQTLPPRWCPKKRPKPIIIAESCAPSAA
jgi:hypothetical protein